MRLLSCEWYLHGLCIWSDPLLFPLRWPWYQYRYLLVLVLCSPGKLYASYPFSRQTQIQFINTLANIHVRVHWPWLIIYFNLTFFLPVFSVCRQALGSKFHHQCRQIVFEVYHVFLPVRLSLDIFLRSFRVEQLQGSRFVDKALQGAWHYMYNTCRESNIQTWHFFRKNCWALARLLPQLLRFQQRCRALFIHTQDIPNSCKSCWNC